MTYIEATRQIFRRADVRVIVLAVIVGQALAAAIGQLIMFLTNAVALVTYPGMPANASWSTALTTTAITALMSFVLWALTAGGAVIILARVLHLTEHGGESPD
jgi:ABC-type Fe3+-siderophore transport system permease subunit